MYGGPKKQIRHSTEDNGGQEESQAKKNLCGRGIALLLEGPARSYADLIKEDGILMDTQEL